MDPHEKEDFDAWDPMKRDWTDENFNSYTSGPGRNLPKNVKDHKDVTTLVIKGVPAEMNQNGLRNIFSKYGDIQTIRLWNGNTGHSTQMGFVTLGSTAECLQALNKENGRSFGSAKLRIELGKTRDQNNSNERNRLDASNDHQSSATPNNSIYGRSLPSPFKNCTPKTIHQSAEFVKVNIDVASIEGPQQMYGLAITHFLKDDDHYANFERLVLEYMETHANGLASVGKPAVGQLVMAKFEGEWARGIIERVMSERGDYLVRFVDYGNTMQAFHSDLKMMPIELCKEAGFACRLKLVGVNIRADSDPTPVIESMQKLIGAVCDCVIKSVTDYCLHIDVILQDGVSLSQTLLESSATKSHVQPYVRPLLDTGDDITAVKLMKLSETNTFRVNYPSHVFGGSKAQIISKQLTEYAQLGPGEPLNVEFDSRGCHVMFFFENLWYRGEIVKISLARQEVLIVALDQDFSGKVRFKDLRCLPLKFAETPRQSCLECVLHGVDEASRIVSVLKPHSIKSLNMVVLAVTERGIYTVKITTPDNEDVTEIAPEEPASSSPTFNQPTQNNSPPTNPISEQRYTQKSTNPIDETPRIPGKGVNSYQLPSAENNLPRSQRAISLSSHSSQDPISTISPRNDVTQNEPIPAQHLNSITDLQVVISSLKEQLAQANERAARLEEQNRKLETRNQELVRQNHALKKFSKF